MKGRAGPGYGRRASEGSHLNEEPESSHGGVQAATHPWAAAYRAGATIREIAGGAGLTESTVRAKLHQLGEPLRARGTPTVDVSGDEVAELRAAGISWRQIARQLNVSQTAARNAMIRDGHAPEDDRQQMSTADKRRLASALSAVPPGRGARFDWAAPAGGAALSQIRALIGRGVHPSEVAVIAGVATTTVTRWLNH